MNEIAEESLKENIPNTPKCDSVNDAIVKEMKRQSDINQDIEKTLQFHENDIKLLKSLCNKLHTAYEDLKPNHQTGIYDTEYKQTGVDFNDENKPTGVDSDDNSDTKPRSSSSSNNTTAATTDYEKYKTLKLKLRIIGDSTSQACKSMSNRLSSLENSALSLLSWANRTSDAFRIISNEIGLEESIIPKLYLSSSTSPIPASVSSPSTHNNNTNEMKIDESETKKNQQEVINHEEENEDDYEDEYDDDFDDNNRIETDERVSVINNNESTR